VTKPEKTPPAVVFSPPFSPFDVLDAYLFFFGTNDGGPGFQQEELTALSFFLFFSSLRTAPRSLFLSFDRRFGRLPQCRAIRIFRRPHLLFLRSMDRALPPPPSLFWGGVKGSSLSCCDCEKTSSWFVFGLENLQGSPFPFSLNITGSTSVFPFLPLQRYAAQGSRRRN